MQQDERGQEPTLALEGDGGIDATTENALLRRILGTLSGRLDLADTVRQLAELICEVTGTDVCFVHVADPATGRLTLAGATPPFDHLAGVITLERG
jgi:two-component system NarL family sensor kinase